MNQHDFATAEGLTELGVENVGPIFTRGVLIDVTGYKGVDVLGDTYTDSPFELYLRVCKIFGKGLIFCLCSILFTYTLNGV